MYCYNLALMAGTINSGGKRELLARGLVRSGALFLLSQLPARDSLLVLTYHRIGNSETDPWDPNLFSATADEFSEQMSYLSRNHWLVTLEEALAFVDGATQDRTPRCRVLITFDDGYLDNYAVAFPILRSLGAQAVFFLCSDLIGSDHIPWWDRIAYVVKCAGKSKFSLRFPADLDVDTERDGLKGSLRKVINLCKGLENTETERFIKELIEVTGYSEREVSLRRFLNWDEARAMIGGGMAVGAHTRTHAMLSKLSEEEQRSEMVQSRTMLREKLGIEADVLAYPYGSAEVFTEQTQQIARESGYRAAFSYYGAMTNRQGEMNRYDLKRVSIASQTLDRFRVQMCIGRAVGKFWP